jgi:hypothetical protein
MFSYYSWGNKNHKTIKVKSVQCYTISDRHKNEPKIHVENLTPKVTVLGGWVIW